MSSDTTEIRNLLVAWRDARQAIFDHQMDKPSDGTRARFTRLSEAEHALMAYAKLVR